MTEREMAAERAEARQATLQAVRAERPEDEASSYLAEIIRSQGWTAAELAELGQQYDHEARRYR
jgi:hypothetical protein